VVHAEVVENAVPLLVAVGGEPDPDPHDHGGLRLRSLSLRSVARLALACWAAVAAIGVLTALLVWEAFGVLGVRDGIEGFVGDLVRSDGYRIGTGPLVVSVVLAAAAFVIAATALSMVAASLYNLMANVTGGLEFVTAPAGSRARVDRGDAGA